MTQILFGVAAKISGEPNVSGEPQEFGLDNVWGGQGARRPHARP
jgi:hypothetical protein